MPHPPFFVLAPRGDGAEGGPNCVFRSKQAHQAVPKHAHHVLRLLRRYDSTNPIHSPQLERLAQLSGPEIRAIVHYWRTQQEPIASSSKGYWYAHQPEELADTISHGEQRIRANREWVNGLFEAQEVLRQMQVHTQGELF